MENNEDMSVRVEEEGRIRIRRSARLAKLYIEPTNRCNLDCRMCIRHVWDEPMGNMSDEVFSRVIEGLRTFSPPPTVFFGGFGEPLFHPRIIEMVARVKSLGTPVEMITNGTLLTADLSRELIMAGLDMLWVSLDGATPESYSDIRLGALLPRVLENVARFRTVLNDEPVAAGGLGAAPRTQLGIEFVAMKRNIADLAAVLDIGQRLGASQILVTHLLPYTKEMCDEVLYYGTAMHRYEVIANHGAHNLNLPRTGIDETVRNDRCPFIEKEAGAIGWDGSLSPCLPLLHNHVSYLYDRERTSRRWAIGNVTETDLFELWNAPEHIAFRERVQAFDFPPCTQCFCDFSEKNEEDCFRNTFPTCGGCLWAQGVIQCP